MFAICLLVMEQSGRGSNSPHPVLPFLPLKTPQRPAQLASAFPLPFSLSIPFASRSVSSSAGPRRCAPTRRCRTRRPRSTGLSAAVVDFPSAGAAPGGADVYAGEGLEPPDDLYCCSTIILVPNTGAESLVTSALYASKLPLKNLDPSKVERTERHSHSLQNPRHLQRVFVFHLHHLSLAVLGQLDRIRIALEPRGIHACHPSSPTSPIIFEIDATSMSIPRVYLLCMADVSERVCALKERVMRDGEAVSEGNILVKQIARRF